MVYGIDFMGLKLKNSVIVSAGPWSGSHKNIQKCIDAGAAAVVTETILTEESGFFGQRVYYNDNELLNLSLYGHKSIEEWEAEFELINKKDSYLICSVRGSSPSELAYIAKRAERLGADALQMDMFAPMDAMIEQINLQPEKLYEMANAVVKSVNIPVMIRMPYNLSSIKAYVRQVEKAGISAICSIESLKGLSGVDIETKETKMPTYGGYTGKHIRPITMAATATLSQLTHCQICSVGGVQDYTNILEFMMLGAVSAMLGSVIMFEGHDIISKTIYDIENWMESHGYSDYKEIRGSALSSLYPYEMAFHSVTSNLKSPCLKIECSKCVKCCMYGAIENISGSIRTNKELCTGCGLCTQICPDKMFYLQ